MLITYINNIFYFFCLRLNHPMDFYATLTVQMDSVVLGARVNSQTESLRIFTAVEEYSSSDCQNVYLQWQRVKLKFVVRAGQKGDWFFGKRATTVGVPLHDLMRLPRYRSIPGLFARLLLRESWDQRSSNAAAALVTRIPAALLASAALTFNSFDPPMSAIRVSHAEKRRISGKNKDP